MLRLYYSPGACSLSVHIALLENNIPYTLTKVDIHSSPHMTQDGIDFATINPKNYVPTIQLDDKEILTEAAAILFYIAEHGPDIKKIGDNEIARYRLQEALTFVSSEMHKSVGTFFNKQVPEEYKSMVRDKIKKRLDYLESVLSKSEYVVGNEFTVADAYCFTILRWVNLIDTGVTLSNWPKLNAYYAKIAKRPKVKQAFAEEELNR